MGLEIRCVKSMSKNCFAISILSDIIYEKKLMGTVFDTNSIPHLTHNDADIHFFKLQNGPVKEKGVNGCQIDDVLQFCLQTLMDFNQCTPSRETSLAIVKIEEAIHWLKARTRDRTKRGVEGTYSP